MQPRCLLIDKDDAHASALKQVAEDCGFVVDLHADIGLIDTLQTDDYDLAIVDLPKDSTLEQTALLQSERLESIEVFVMSDVDAPEDADRAIRLGASYFFCKPFTPDNLRPLLEDIAGEVESSAADPVSMNSQTPDQFGMLRGSSRGMRKLFRQIRKVAQVDTSVLIVGESGAGKELVAHTLHLMSPRRDGPYVAFNCAAVPASLAESELFGHEKGAFSGATQRHRGYFERASGGTLLLDEITEMDPDLQAKLLRVLETGTLRRLGSEKDIRLDTRVISACNRPPEDAIREARLREDLYYRLAQFPLRVPPLRRRGEDIVGLARYFLRELNDKHDTAIQLGSAGEAVLNAYDWPGNVRELKHLVERAYIMSDRSLDDELTLTIQEQKNGQVASGGSMNIEPGMTIAEVERKLIFATLEHTGNDKASAAEMLGISVKTLYNRLKAYAEES